MKKTYLILTLAIALLASCGGYAYAQSPNTIKQRCPSPYGSIYGQVSITAAGNIVVNPCPTKATTFTGAVNLPTGTAVSGSGTGNYFAQWTSPTNLSSTPLSWNGVSYLFNNTGLNADFNLNITPSFVGNGLFRAGKSGTAYLALDDTAGSVTLTSLGNTNITSSSGLMAITASSGAVTVNGSTSAFIRSASTRIGNDNAGNLTFLGISDAGKSFTFATTGNLGVFNAAGINTYQYQKTITAAGTTGNQSIAKPAGSVNLAIGASSIVVTNSTVTTSSIILATAQAADASCSVKNAVPTANTITITMTAACGAETRVAFLVLN